MRSAGSLGTPRGGGEGLGEGRAPEANSSVALSFDFLHIINGHRRQRRSRGPAKARSRARPADRQGVMSVGCCWSLSTCAPHAASLLIVRLQNQGMNKGIMSRGPPIWAQRILAVHNGDGMVSCLARTQKKQKWTCS